MTTAPPPELTDNPPQDPGPPGHPDAVKAGCTCPAGDNSAGRGNGWKVAETNEVLFWFREDCPLHGGKNAKPLDMRTWCVKDTP